MALSQVQIVNQALDRIGAQRIASLEDSSVEARAASSAFDALRDELLCAYPWGFARRRAALNRDSDAPAFGYDYAYLLPADYLDMVKVQDDPVFEIEGGKLLTDAEEVSILYTARTTDVSKFPPNFTAALWRYFALHFAMSIAKSKSLRDVCYQEYVKAFGEAANADARQSQPDETPYNSYLAARS